MLLFNNTKKKLLFYRKKLTFLNQGVTQPAPGESQHPSPP